MLALILIIIIAVCFVFLCMMFVIFRVFSLIPGLFRGSLAVFAAFYICYGAFPNLLSGIFYVFGWLTSHQNRRCKCDWLYFCSFNCNKRPSSLHWNVCWHLCAGCCRVLRVSSSYTIHHPSTEVTPECFLINHQSTRQQVLSVLVNICEQAALLGLQMGAFLCLCISGLIIRCFWVLLLLEVDFRTVYHEGNVSRRGVCKQRDGLAMTSCFVG